MNTSRYINELEDFYCNNRSAVTSAGLSCVSASLPTRIINGGKKVIYTATMTAMLLNNTIPSYAALTVSSWQSSSFLTVGTAYVANYGNYIANNLYNYGSIFSTTVERDGWAYIYNGGTANQTILSSGHQIISSGGSAISTVISNGVQTVYGGWASKTIIYNGGIESISSEGKSLDAVIRNGGYQEVWGGNGSSLRTIISSGGIQDVYHAIAISTSVYNGGNQNISSAGVASNTVIKNGGSQTIKSGGHAISTIISSAGSQFILNGGSADYTYVLSGAEQYISSGGAANSNTLYAGGILHAEDGAIVNGTIVSSGGSEYVSSGATVNDTILNSGGNQYVLDGGTTNRTVINSSGYQSVYLGGLANDTTINNGGLQDVAGRASGTVVSSGGLQHILVSGSAVGTNVDGGTQTVDAGAFTSSAVINNSGVQNILGESFKTTISSGVQNVSSGALIMSTTILAGGTQNLSSGASDRKVSISGGVQNILAGASAASSWISANGKQNVYGQISSVDLYGGNQNVYNGGIASHTLAITSNAQQNVSSGGSALATSAMNGGIQNVLAGGYASGTSIDGIQNVAGSAIKTTVSSGTQNLSSGATATSTTLLNNGTQNISNGASALVVNISGGTQNISGGGYASQTLISNGGVQNIAGVAVNNTVNSGGNQYVLSGGVASSNTISSYGIQYVSNNAVANDTTINAGTQTILSGGVASSVIMAYRGTQNVAGIANDVIVNSSSIQNVNSGGVVNGATVSNESIQYVYGGGTVNDVTITTSGAQMLSNGATANSTVISNSGYQFISSGATANTVTNNGAVSLYSGGILNNYSGNGELLVYGNNTISGTTNIGSGLLFMALDAPSTVTIENLSANNATVRMGVNLEDQSEGISDQLRITSSYNGSAVLQLRNKAFTANATSGTGIKLIDIDEHATGDGTFELLGGKWDEGGYIYQLLQDEGDPSYYLRTGGLTDTFKTMANIPMLNAVVAKTGMNSLTKRMGQLRDFNNPTAKQGVWARTYYKDMTVKDLLKTDMSLFGVEAGYDWLFRADEPTKLYAGVMLGYMQANSIKTKNSVGDTNDGNGSSPSIGLYATLANETGWFIDFAARNFWTKIDNTTKTSSNTLLKFDSNRNLFTTSIEAGKKYVNDSGLNIEPKAELSFMQAGAASSPVTGGTGNLDYDAETYITGKAAIMFSYKQEMENKLLVEPLLELAYNQEFAGTGKVKYGGAETETSLKGGSFEIGAGFSMQIDKDLYWHALGTYEAGNKLSGWGLNAGIRFGFGGTDKKNKETDDDRVDYSLLYNRNTQKKKTDKKEKQKGKQVKTQTVVVEEIGTKDGLLYDASDYENSKTQNIESQKNKKNKKAKKQEKKREDYDSLYEYYRDLVR